MKADDLPSMGGTTTSPTHLERTWAWFRWFGALMGRQLMSLAGLEQSSTAAKSLHAEDFGAAPDDNRIVVSTPAYTLALGVCAASNLGPRRNRIWGQEPFATVLFDYSASPPASERSCGPGLEPGRQHDSFFPGACQASPGGILPVMTP